MVECAKMAYSKGNSSKSKKWISGGKGKMFGKQSVGTQVPGQSAQMHSGSGRVGQAATKSTGRMFGKQSAKPSKAR